jgi:hypothetical protein
MGEPHRNRIVGKILLEEMGRPHCAPGCALPWASGFGVFCFNPERIIRLRLAEVAQAASFPARKLRRPSLNSQRLTTFCTADIEIIVAIPGRGQQRSGGMKDSGKWARDPHRVEGGVSRCYGDPRPRQAIGRRQLDSQRKCSGEKEMLVQG